MSSIIQEVSFGKNKKVEIIVHPGCPICTAKDKDGKGLRLQIDRYLLEHSNNKTNLMLKDLGIHINVATLRKHALKHSPYLAKFKEKIVVATKHALVKGIDSLEEDLGNVFWSPEDVVQTIINIGGQKIKSGEMAVDSKLLLGALSEQGRRNQQGTLADLLDELNRRKFPVLNGEIVDNVKELKDQNEIRKEVIAT